MSPLGLVLGAVGGIAATGLLALVLARTPRAATLVAVLGAVLGGAAGLWGALQVLATGRSLEAVVAWQVPSGSLVVGIDPLSAFFLAPLFALGAVCAVYGRSYLGPRAVAAAELDFLLAAMALVLVARHALLFLVAWEVMALAGYLLLIVDHGEPETRRAGWVYLIASHVAVTALIGLFLVLGARAGGACEFAALADAWRVPGAAVAGVLVLALLGFGIKAGVVGLHVWLPEAHAAAPSHVSALMSGVLIELGLYGLLRTAMLVPVGAGFGLSLMILGAAGALLGIALALYQRDVKRILAYSSVENVGIVLLGLGLGFWARARGDGRLAALAFAGALLHVWNHAAMKGLMFLGAGSVVHATGTKDLERLGGLLRRMPWTGRAMIVGAIALAALPPLNGFAGEWLLYRGFALAGQHGRWAFSLAAIGAAVLALVGGMAALCFVRFVGLALLGAPRSEGARRAHEAPLAMALPIACLALACLAGALAAPSLVSLQTSLLADLRAAGAADVAAAAGQLAPVVAVCAALAVSGALTLALLARRVRGAAADETWGCGYAAPSARMQYSGAGFAELFCSRVLPSRLRARARAAIPREPFPAAASFASDAADPLTRGVYEPFLLRCGDRFARLRFLQQGRLHVYLVYIAATVIVGLAWVAAREWWLP